MPVLYTFGGSVWAAVAELAVAELYPEGAIEQKQVVLIKGENFAPSFLRINPNATLPTLETPDEGVKTSTKDVVKYLVDHSDKKAKAGTEIIDVIHEEKYDPNFALLLARNEEELKAKGGDLPGAFVAGRQEALTKYAAHPEAAPHKEFYDKKIRENGGLKAIFDGTAPEEVTKGFIANGNEHVGRLAEAIYGYLPSILPSSGFIGGEVPGEDDYHVGGWLTRIAATLGAQSAEDGLIALGKLREGKPLTAQVESYWKSWTARDSWKKVYAQSLH